MKCKGENGNERKLERKERKEGIGKYGIIS
jgi:hypothetical protein